MQSAPRMQIASAGRALVAAVAVSALLGCASGPAEEGSAAADPVQTDFPSQSAPSEQSSSAPASPEPQQTEQDEEESSDAEAVSADSGAGDQAAEPAGLQIPSIDLDEDVMVDLEIADDGRLAEPSGWNDVGWFSAGSRPGEYGSTVIAAHVDSPTGPAVFYRVLEMQQGDEVTVVDADGEDHLYRVERTADFPKDDYPTREVFGTNPEDQLRLITCTGEFDQAERSYDDNRVVFASRVN